MTSFNGHLTFRTRFTLPSCSSSSANVCQTWLFSARWNNQPCTHWRCLLLAIATGRTWSHRPRRKCYSEDNRKCPGSVGQASKNSRKLLYSVEWALECGESAVRRGLRPGCESLDDRLLKIKAHVCACVAQRWGGFGPLSAWPYILHLHWKTLPATITVYRTHHTDIWSENETQKHYLRVFWLVAMAGTLSSSSRQIQCLSIIHPYIWSSSDPLLPLA